MAAVPSVPAGSTPLSLTGTAATGAAIAGRAVEAKCATGTGTVSSGADGSYTISVADGTLPCALRVTAADGTVLYSVAQGTGTSAVANINPVSHLVVAALTGTDPASFYSNFSATTASAVTSGTVSAAVTAVVDTLKSAGVDLSSVGNVLTASLVAANGSTAGNAYDQALDALKAAQAASGTTLADLTQTVAATAAVTPVAAASPSGTPSLPADLLLKPAASSCAALRSGVYRVIPLQPSTGPIALTGKITVNATTLAITNGVDNWSWTPAANEPCRFTGDTGEDVVVLPAGVITSRDHDTLGDPFHMAIGFPEQAHTVAELQGSWNKLGMTRNDANNGFKPDAATATFNGSGVTTAIDYCADVKTCVPVTNQVVTLSLNSTGGFDRTFSNGNPADRMFVYRAGGGELMGVTLASDGLFGLWTRQRTNALPVVGAVSSIWNLVGNNQLVSTTGITVGGNTIVTVDAATGAFTRNNITTAPVTRPESLVANAPRAGYTFRNAGTVTDSAGATSNVGEFVSLPLRGMGLTPVAALASAQFTLSVVKP